MNAGWPSRWDGWTLTLNPPCQADIHRLKDGSILGAATRVRRFRDCQGCTADSEETAEARDAAGTRRVLRWADRFDIFTLVAKRDT